MKADPRFLSQGKPFWAAIRSLSQIIGYTIRKRNQVKTPTFEELKQALRDMNLNYKSLGDMENQTEFSKTLLSYYEYRTNVLNEFVEPRLMNAERAKQKFNELQSNLNPKCLLPMNKQKGEKRNPAYFTGIINMLIEKHSAGLACDFDPRKLTTITKEGLPLRTFARRIDGAFPSTVNPTAVWEIKEYYYTTTFGSRVADGVYETLLDGLELTELYEHERRKVLHYLMLDAYYTWWKCGKPYLCRIIDMLNMGYCDEVLFGYEVIERLPDLVKNWVRLAT